MDPARSIDELTSKNIATVAKMEEDSRSVRTTGERMADSFASVMGSWTFILLQTTLLAIWVLLNLMAWARHWDPYPFILLNLALSFQSAYAAPILMMSQNRQSRLSERRHHLDLQINMLAEQETTEILRLLRTLCEQNGVSLPDDREPLFEEETRHEEIIRRIEDELETRIDPDSNPAASTGAPAS
ncbi:DUF1003 domain-containing protein [Paludisphaera mucosa]|uniref:DUF1003 domain-containing protein n=1 Tax=Paludisphaera mucosa TaxID=3030827 RepID=A0ABT6FJW9_9BACT|nr:DUF1003 domain-containing protein [Paludisphaera mucosa]MDG3007796.1 DUF1003 domain-containing protein [Paludisphaera mucosa]